MTAPGVLVEFAARPGTADGDYVLRKAPVIFRAGRYGFADAPDFEMSPADIRRAAEGFEPVPLCDTHRSEGSVFHGRLGELVAVEPSADGASFGGTVRLPRWLDDVFKGVTVPLSATWDRVTKRLKNVALVSDPRIEGAGLEAAFAAAHPQEKPTVTTETVSADLAAEVAELKRQNETYRRQAEQNAAEFAAERLLRQQGESAGYARKHARGLGQQGYEALAELHFALTEDDRGHGDATFALEGRPEHRKGRRLEALARLVAAVEALPRLLSREQLAGTEAVFNRLEGTDANTVNQSDRERMLKSTPLGQQILAERAGKNGGN